MQQTLSEKVRINSIGQEDEKHIWSYVNSTRFCNVIGRFPDLSIDILKNSITFHFYIVKVSYSLSS